MTAEDRMKMEHGQLALALVLAEFERRVRRKDLSEQEVADLMTTALDRFPPDFQAALRAELAERAPAG